MCLMGACGDSSATPGDEPTDPRPRPRQHLIRSCLDRVQHIGDETFGVEMRGVLEKPEVGYLTQLEALRYSTVR